MALYEEWSSTRRKSDMVVVVSLLLPMVRGMVIEPSGCTISLENPQQRGIWVESILGDPHFDKGLLKEDVSELPFFYLYHPSSVVGHQHHHH